jgi:hypothetical protein
VVEAKARFEGVAGWVVRVCFFACLQGYLYCRTLRWCEILNCDCKYSVVKQRSNRKRNGVKLCFCALRSTKAIFQIGCRDALHSHLNKIQFKLLVTKSYFAAVVAI